jgi:hypothetical protein
MNSMQLKDKLKNISKEKNIDFNTFLRLYMYDRFFKIYIDEKNIYLNIEICSFIMKYIVCISCLIL